MKNTTKWIIKSKHDTTKDGQEILPERFNSKREAEIFFEENGMDYDYYEIDVEVSVKKKV